MKKRWYRRQAKRATWFLRYVDLTIHSLGWNRPKIRKFWEDFTKHPQARAMALDQMAIINKIAIKRAGTTRRERAFDQVVALNRKLQLELNAVNAKLAQAQPAPMTESEKARLQGEGLAKDAALQDAIVADILVQEQELDAMLKEEETHEVPIV